MYVKRNVEAGSCRCR